MLLRYILLAMFVGVVTLCCLAASGAPPSDTPPPSAPYSEAGMLMLPVTPAPASATAAALLSAGDRLWRSAPAAPLHLTRTPPIHVTDPRDDGYRPSASVKMLRLADGRVAARLHWTDYSKNAGPSSRPFPDGGEKHIYPRHSERIETFADAAAIMVPVQRGPHATYPGIMMGDPAQPVELYYWRAGQGYKLLRAGGRATVTDMATATTGTAVHEASGWTVIVLLPYLTARTPVAFAIWDGARGQRGGLKLASMWYEVK